jgi:hypothetical protein
MSTIDRSRMNVLVQQTNQRVTAPPAGRQFSEALARGGQAVVRAAIAVAQHIPGADVAAAALRGAGTSADPGMPASPGAPLSAGGGSGSTGAAAEGPSSVGTNAAAGAAGVAGVGGEADLLTRGQEMSMRMLRLQEAMSEENRRYTALSNVMHARHEMSKNAINNIR